MTTLGQKRQNEIAEIGNLAMTHFLTLNDDDKAWYVRHWAMRAAGEASATNRKYWLAFLKEKVNA